MTQEHGRASATPPLLIGLTGPIGCGKSTIGRMLGDLGGMVIDADILARRATEPGRSTLPLIRERFGATVFGEDGELDRAAMARVAFQDPAALADLEKIVHPEVRRMVTELLDAAAADDAPFVVVEAIKLVEGGLAERCDEVWLIECRRQTQLDRLLARGTSGADAEQRVGAQGEDLVDRLAAAVETMPGTRLRRLSTDGTPDATRELAEDALAEALVETPAR